MRHWKEKTPFGTIYCLQNEQGLAVATFDPEDPRLQQNYQQMEEASGFWAAYEEFLITGRCSLPLAPTGTAFQQKVWQELSRIPTGESIVYSEIATRLGRISLTRAAASAVAANPIALLIPCHRVLPKQGGVGQFRWGSELKARLLAHERNVITAPV